MLQSKALPQTTNDATACAYFLYGIESGLLAWDSAKEWAFDKISEQDNPSIEIINIATTNQREPAIDSLSVVVAGADLALAGRLLLAALHDELEAGRIALRPALRMALQITSSTCPRSQAYYDFDMLDDEPHLAESGTYGTVSDVLNGTLTTLRSPAMQSVGTI